jgi:SAM-dependent methyltransferase
MQGFIGPPPLPAKEECRFYHAMDIPSIGSVPGIWDLRGRFSDYTGGVELRGKTFLDVGTASGFFTFEAEQRGARVTSFDAESYDQMDYVALGNSNRRDNLSRIKNSYWFAHHHFKSRAQVVYGNIRNLSVVAPPSDVVLLGQILVHLRDPLDAIRQASLLAGENLVITEGSFESEEPLAAFLGTGDGAGIHSWWHLSAKLYDRWLSLLGFEIVQTTRNKYRCNDASLSGDVEVWTYVARRK